MWHQTKILNLLTIVALLPQMAFGGDPASSALVLHRHGTLGLHPHLVSLASLERGDAESSELGHGSKGGTAAVKSRAVIIGVVVGSPAGLDRPASTLADSVANAAIPPADWVADHPFANLAERPRVAHEPFSQLSGTLLDILERNHAILV